MELIDTPVLRQTGTDWGEFHGEGGESVRLASGDTKRTDDEIITAAKVMLVQIAHSAWRRDECPCATGSGICRCRQTLP